MVCWWCGKDIDSGRFCSRACRVAYENQKKKEKEAKKDAKEAKKEAKVAKKDAKVAKKDAKAQKIEARREAKALKIEVARQTSDESLAMVKKFCFIGGLFAAHRFYVGKVKSAIALDAWLLLVVLLAISDRDLSILILIVLVNLLVWVIDLLKIVCKKFTDKGGRTIRE